MSLFVVATPIGHPGDITLRALEILKTAEVIIGEERSEVSKLLKRLGIVPTQMELLNEHSKDQDVLELADLCRDKICALVSDCGTPVFCDPGAKLIHLCRSRSIEIKPAPGASSLMTLLSMVSQRVDKFVFEGFLPADKVLRGARLEELKREKRAVILMDTPYRLEKTIAEIASTFAGRRALLGIDLTQETEKFIESSVTNLSSHVRGQKAEFIVCVYP
jgi:16S rRNA (cytidine1402-2'-O)-methyltransferase